MTFWIRVLFFMVLGAGTAHAYLDPVSGSLIIQGIVALVAGIVAGVKSVRQRIVSGCRAVFARMRGR